MQNAQNGLGFWSLLTLVFITLKLTGVIHWSWWWVLAPFWGPIAFVLLVIIVFLAVYIIKNI